MVVFDCKQSSYFSHSFVKTAMAEYLEYWDIKFKPNSGRRVLFKGSYSTIKYGGLTIGHELEKGILYFHSCVAKNIDFPYNSWDVLQELIPSFPEMRKTFKISDDT